jgi:hypothetical protein
MCSSSFAGLSSFSLSSHERPLKGPFSGVRSSTPTAARCLQDENKWIAPESVREIVLAAARSSAQKINPHPLYEHALKVRLRALIDDILLVDHSPSPPDAVRGRQPD